MVQNQAKTVAAYLKELPSERRAVIAAVRRVMRRHMPKGYRETMAWGGICYEVPLKRYPDTYNGKPLVYAGLGAQKNYFAVYLTCAYTDPVVTKRLREGFKRAGKRLDMGKICIRFRKLEDLPLEVIGEAIASTPVDAFLTKCEAVWPCKPARKRR
jgi:hypothetical protein